MSYQNKRLVDNATLLDIEIAKKLNTSQKIVQRQRIEGERKIKRILVLDEYLNWIKVRNFKVTNQVLVDTNYKTVMDCVNHYPFDGGHFKVDYNTLMSALDVQTYKKFKKEYKVPYELHEIMEMDKRRFKEVLASRKYLIILSKQKPRNGETT